jgi:hypothetical protein
MAVATVAQIKTRIETLADAAITTLLTGSEYAIARSTLPAVEIRAGAAERRKHGAQITQTTREFEIWLFVAEITNPEDPTDVNTALEACYPYCGETVPDYFAARPQLQDASKANSLVFATGEMSDSGPATSPHKQKTYAAVRFTLPVVTVR